LYEEELLHPSILRRQFCIVKITSSSSSIFLLAWSNRTCFTRMFAER